MAETFRTRTCARDIAAVAALVRGTGVFSADEIQIARELVEENLARGADASGYHFLFADGADGIEGYACFGPIAGTVGRWELYWIAVDPGLRRSGLARGLQQGAEDGVRAKGGVYLIAETSSRPDYEPARRFYQALGYARLAEVPDWHDDGDGLVIFGKRL